MKRIVRRTPELKDAPPVFSDEDSKNLFAGWCVVEEPDELDIPVTSLPFGMQEN